MTNKGVFFLMSINQLMAVILRMKAEGFSLLLLFERKSSKKRILYRLQDEDVDFYKQSQV
jgi:hypothetical protein